MGWSNPDWRPVDSPETLNPILLPPSVLPDSTPLHDRLALADVEPVLLQQLLRVWPASADALAVPSAASDPNDAHGASPDTSPAVAQADAPAEAEPAGPAEAAHDAPEAGPPTNALSRGLGFGAQALESPDFRVSPNQVSRVVQRALRLAARPDLGLELGSSFNVVSWGLCLIGLMACSSLREVLETATEFTPATSKLLKLSGEVEGDEFIVTAEPMLPDAAVNEFLVQHAFASLARVCRFVVSGWYGPKRVDFQSAAVLPVETTLAAFGCLVRTGCTRDRMVFALVDQPIATADSLVARMVRRMLTQQHGGVGTQSELEAAILQMARTQLVSPPSAAAFAASMNISERTLRRRLHELDLSYAMLIDRERMRLALSLLQDRSVRYEAVALAVGLSDTRALRRAVHRWTGRSPSQLRNNAA